MRWHLTLLVALSALVHGWVVANSSLTARDSVGFARQALSLADPVACGFASRADVLRNTQQPPGYPVVVLAVHRIVKIVSVAPLPEKLLLATQLASGLAAVLFVFPFYSLARVLLTPRAAFAAGAIYQLLPAVARYTSDGLSESLFLLFTITSLWLGVRGLLNTGRRWYFLAGLTAGCAYLVRPEGLGVGVAMTTTLSVIALRRKVGMTRWAGTVAAVVIGMAIPAAPYMLVIGGMTNKPAGKGMDPTAMALDPVGTSPALLAEYRPSDAAKTTATRAAWSAKAAVAEYLHATHYSVGILSLVGLCAFAGRLSAEPCWAILIVYAAIHLAALMIAAGYRAGYVSDRHMLPLVPVAVLLAVRVLKRLPRYGPWVCYAIAVSCLAPLSKSLHENRVGHKHAGLFLAGVLTDRDGLVDPFEWAAFVSGRTLHRTETTKGTDTVYVVLDDAKGNSPHHRLRQMPEALQLTDDPRAQLVFTWPPGASTVDAKVRVYRCPVSVGRSAESATAPKG